ncbi:MAG: hypothetical protein OXH99_18905 [Bryobacterales bacterium]|nr:hypothetical protein [Bryobacterales bacterium]
MGVPLVQVWQAILPDSVCNSIPMLDSKSQRAIGSLGYFEESLASNWPAGCWWRPERTL